MARFPGINQQLGKQDDSGDDEDVSTMMKMASNPNADERMAMYKNLTQPEDQDQPRSIKDFSMSQGDMDSLNSPSIMDQYIKQNDPNQYNKIQQAHNIQGAIDLGSSTALGAKGMTPEAINVAQQTGQ